MANTKNYSIRERVLDRYLSSGHWYSSKELMSFCNREFESRGEKEITSRSTLQNDFLEIENKYKTIIEKRKKGRTTLYRYADRNFSIFKSELSIEDHQHITEALNVLSKFHGMPQFEWIDEMAARMNICMMNDGNPVVGFEDGIYNVGMNHFSKLFDVIKERVAIDITYKSFKKQKAEVFSISPYYLKQYNNRWFLLGRTLGFAKMGVFPLDRIQKVENSGKKYEPCNTNFNEYFEDIVGVSKPTEKCERVEIWFSKEQLKYVETKPIHGSQRILEQNEDGGIVQLDIIPNYELQQLILSYGEKAKVLSPAHFKEKIRMRIANSLKNY